jgi:hypothetical protein
MPIAISLLGCGHPQLADARRRLPHDGLARAIRAQEALERAVSLD